MAKRQFTDNDFLEGLKNNSGNVLEDLYRKHYPQILKYILNNSGTEEEAQDIYQESIIVLYNNVRKDGFELSCALQTYLYSVAKRLWLKQLNRNKVLFKLEDNEEPEADVNIDITFHEEKETRFAQMNLSMDALGEPCRSLIEDFYVRKMNMEAIAEKFGYTNADNAKNQKYKCLQRLKRLYFKDNPNEKH